MYRSRPWRSTLNTGYITGLDMCKVCTEAVHCAALWTCVQVQKNVIIPTPPYPMWCVRGWLWVEKMMQNCPVCTCDSSLCARVTLENGCVRTWLQSVCAGDSGWKKWCKIVPVYTCDSRVCARVTPWPLQMLITWQGVEHAKLGCFGTCLVGASNLKLKRQDLRAWTRFSTLSG